MASYRTVSEGADFAAYAARAVSSSEIGSEFHWCDVPSGPRLPWPAPNVLLSRGRDALLACIEGRVQPRRRLFVPEYFCSNVLGIVSHAGVEVRGYSHSPRDLTPDWSTLQAEPGDAVLAVNFFGAMDGLAWRNWRQENQDVHLFEDHTHDPVSPWALASRADFAFASLRKTLPVPDGAILWSPAGHVLPAPPPGRDWSGSALKLAGMIFKRQYLRDGGGESVRRADFRVMEIHGERVLVSTAPQIISPWSRMLVATGYPLSWRRQRETNVRRFIDLFRQELDQDFPVELLYTRWERGHCPFNPVLVFANPASRHVCRQALIQSHIYAPVHWPLDAKAGPEAYDLSRRILTVPVDHRCDMEDLDRIVSCIYQAVSGESIIPLQVGDEGA